MVEPETMPCKHEKPYPPYHEPNGEGKSSAARVSKHEQVSQLVVSEVVVGGVMVVTLVVVVVEHEVVNELVVMESKIPKPQGEETPPRVHELDGQ